VNISDNALDTRVELRGLDWDKAEAHLTVLTSNSPEDENSFALPRRVYPVEEFLGKVRASLRHTFPPHSLSIFRFSKE
jgi:alpha-L-arabinofuranosidase